MFKFALGQQVQGPEFSGRVVALAAYEDGRRLAFVRGLVTQEGEAPREQWLPEASLRPKLGNEDAPPAPE